MRSFRAEVERILKSRVTELQPTSSPGSSRFRLIGKREEPGDEVGLQLVSDVCHAMRHGKPNNAIVYANYFFWSKNYFP